MPFILFVVIAAVVFFYWKKKNRSKAEANKDTYKEQAGAPKPAVPDEPPFPNAVQAQWKWYPLQGALEHLTLLAVIGEGILLADDKPYETLVRYTVLPESVRLSLKPFCRVVNGFKDNLAGQYLIRLAGGNPGKEYFIQRSLYNKQEDTLELYFDVPTDPYECAKLKDTETFIDYVKKYAPHIQPAQAPEGEIALTYAFSQWLFRRFSSETIAATAIVAAGDKPIGPLPHCDWRKPTGCLEHLRLLAALGELGATRKPGTASLLGGRTLEWIYEKNEVTLYLNEAEELIAMLGNTTVGRYLAALYAENQIPGADTLCVSFDVSDEPEAAGLFWSDYDVYACVRRYAPNACASPEAELSDKISFRWHYVPAFTVTDENLTNVAMGAIEGR